MPFTSMILSRALSTRYAWLSRWARGSKNHHREVHGRPAPRWRGAVNCLGCCLEAAAGGPTCAASGDPPPSARLGRGRGPKALSTILPELLKRLGGEAAQMLGSALSGETP
jgi:hypothetical protein